MESPLGLAAVHSDHEPERRVRGRGSVVECASPLALSRLVARSESASRRRAEAALWRAAKAEGLAQSKTWRQAAPCESLRLCLRRLPEGHMALSHS
jgi:hypothetical protein